MDHPQLTGKLSPKQVKSLNNRRAAASARDRGLVRVSVLVPREDAAAIRRMAESARALRVRQEDRKMGTPI